MKSFLLATSMFGIGIPVLLLGLSSLQQTQLTAQSPGCEGAQVFRVSDQSCYTLQGE